MTCAPVRSIIHLSVQAHKLCSTSHLPQMYIIFSTGAQKLIGDWLALQILAACSLLCAGFGLFSIYFLGKAKEDRKRRCGLLTTTFWLLTGMLKSSCRQKFYPPDT